MTSEHTTSEPVASYPPGSMRVEQGSTPDGRLLLYFTFPESDQAAASTAPGEGTATVETTTAPATLVEGAANV